MDNPWAQAEFLCHFANIAKMKPVSLVPTLAAHLAPTYCAAIATFYVAIAILNSNRILLSMEILALIVVLFESAC